MSAKTRSTSFRITRTFLLASLLAGLPASALAQVTITGSSQQITTDPSTQLDPSISGKIVCYTDYRNGNSEVFYYDLGTGLEHQATTNAGVTSQTLCDVSGNTIVYTEFTLVGSDVKAFVIGGSISNVSGDGTSLSPGIDGSLVAWVDYITGTKEIHAIDLSTGIVKTLTNNRGNDSFSPNVSNRLVAYSTKNSTTCQVFVTNFDTLVTTQITNSATGCNNSVDISGSHVVYEADRGGSTGQDIFVYDLVAQSETELSLPGIQRNPHVSGDWVAFEDVSSFGVSSIKLYHIPSATVLTAVQATSTLDSAYLNDIDGTNVAYTSNAAGNADIYVFSFTVSSQATTTALASSVNPSVLNQPITFTATVTSTAGTPSGNVTFSDGSNTLATVVLSSSGEATLITSSLAVGSHTITAQYPAQGGFNGSNSSLTQTVEYAICPLYDQTKAVHSGAVIPIKIELCDINGNDVSSSAVVVHAVGVVMVSTNAPGILETAGNANPDNDFRFDSTLGAGGGYIFNLSTSGLGTGTYNLNFTAGNDPVPHSVQFQLK